MLEYVKRCRSKYTKGNEAEYIRCLLSGIIGNEGNEKVVRRATKAMLELNVEQGHDCFISRKDIFSRARFERYHGPGSGLWPWLEENADVIEKAQGRRAYRIKNEFYPVMDRLCPVIGQGLCGDSC